MSAWAWAALAAAASLTLYLSLVLVLLGSGRRVEARALAGFVHDCVALLRRLLGDPRVPRRHRLLIVAAVAYLAMPVDLVPDFVPVAGQLDDAIVVALVLRRLLRAAGPEVVREHWPGPEASLRLLLRLAAQ